MASASELRSPSWCACRRSALSPASKPPRSPALLPMTTTVATRSEYDASMGVASACEKASTPRPSPHRSAGTLSSAPCTGVCWQPERRISSPLSPARESSLSSSIPSSPAAPRGQRKQPRFNGCYGLDALRRQLDRSEAMRRIALTQQRGLEADGGKRQQDHRLERNPQDASRRRRKAGRGTADVPARLGGELKSHRAGRE